MQSQRNKLTAMPNHVAFADNSQLARNKTPPPRISRRLKQAIDAIVHDAKSWNEAANENGLTMRTIRLAFERPHVMAYYKAQCQVLRVSHSARNIHRLCEIRDAENNMPAVNAIKALELIGDEQTNKPNVPSAGITIRIVNVATPPQHAIDVKATEMQPDQINAEQTND
jgi:hypothetical protein